MPHIVETFHSLLFVIWDKSTGTGLFLSQFQCSFHRKFHSHRQCKNPTASLLPSEPSTTHQQVMQSRDAARPLWKEEELPDLHPICLLLCQTTQLQGIAIHFFTPSSKHLSITDFNSSHSVCEWEAKINWCAYLSKRPGSHIMQNLHWVTESIFCTETECVVIPSHI